MARLSNLLSVLSLMIWLPLCARAHMQMSSPYALRSPLDPSVSESWKDYDNASPLKSDGSNFPCKHYQYSDANPQAYDTKATYQVGQTYSLTLSGSATHMGGSCQISLSYDNGQTFKVIESMIGGCPLAYTYNFTIPSFAPSSDAVLLSWSWFNLIGNREMYQNCARVQVVGSNPTQRYRRTSSRHQLKRQSALNSLPDMFVCNVGNGCHTIERREVVFPDPGANVIYGTDETTPEPGPGYTLDSSSTDSGSTSSTVSDGPPSSTTTLTTTSSTPLPLSPTNTFPPTEPGLSSNSSSNAIDTLSSPTASTFPTPATSTSDIATLIATPLVPTTPSTSTAAAMAEPTTTSAPVLQQQLNTTSSAAPTTTLDFITTRLTSVAFTPFLTSSPTTPTNLITITTTPSASSSISTSTATATATSTPSLSLPCTPGQFACNTIASFSQCIATADGASTYIYMGAVAAGTQCQNGQIVRQNAGPCTPNGGLFCNGPAAFSLCDQGGLVDMGPVAPGTECLDGLIVASS